MLRRQFRQRQALVQEVLVVLAARSEGERSLADHGRHVRRCVAKKVGQEAQGPGPSAIREVRGKGWLGGHAREELAAKLELRVQVAALGGFGVGPEQHDQPQSTDSAFVPYGSVEAVHIGHDQLAPLKAHPQVLLFHQHIHGEALGA